MLTIKKRVWDRKYYLYGGTAAVVCFAGLTTAVVWAHSMHERLAAAVPTKSEQSTQNEPSSSPQPEENQTMTGADTVDNKLDSVKSTPSPSTSPRPAASVPVTPDPTPAPTTEPSPTPDPMPSPDPTTTPSPEPTDEPAN